MYFILIVLGMTSSVRASQTAEQIFFHPNVGQVQVSQFQVGQTWTWTHSELTKTGSWKPTLLERYKVTQVSGTEITIEMSSDPPSSQTTSHPHHKFIFDFSSCERARQSVVARLWTVKFYTTSFNGSWTLVSATHPNYVFTEKFNCSTPTEREVVQSGTYEMEDGSYSIFHINRAVKEDTSWYLSDHPKLSGVLATKIFEPTQRYRAELTEW